MLQQDANRNFEKNILEDCMLTANSRGTLVLAVFVQDGVPVFVGEGCLYPNNKSVQY